MTDTRDPLVEVSAAAARDPVSMRERVSVVIAVEVHELDLATAPLVQAQVDEALGGAECAALSIDLTAVTFMDCGGIRPLLRAREVLGEAVTLTGAQPGVLRLLDLTGLRGAFVVVAASPPGSPR